ncbi:MAG: M23 family metallopeptidase [Armatimonadota bacterium]|nr:M23 family metallopeptidase [Armatimonadota bacterium]MDR7443413.1 M23 family metallopeptidase [Armatimonadota bacterium]MDR7568450.1 M23 family metallopeptidase [Armatimonadota bacterium]MDR7602400.1 M23 family metallopeptidase [Armatimonadota bacterium]
MTDALVGLALALGAALGTLLTPIRLEAPLLRVTPAEVVQGNAFRIDVEAPGGTTRVRATVAGRTLVLYRTATGFQGFAGTDPTTPPGKLAVRVQVELQGRELSLVRTVRVRPARFAIRYLRVPPELLDPRLAAYERRRVLAATSAPLPRPLWDGPFRLPVAGPVASPYGVRSVYNGQPRGHHLGVDIRAAAGTPVRTAQQGAVVLAERLPLGGNTVIVDHGAGVFTSYLHLQSLAVSVGARLRQGQVVGFVGSTGLSTAPHLHWAVRVNGVPVNPMEWVQSQVLSRP